MKIKNRKVIEVSDWNDLVSEHYNKHYNFQQQDDCKSRGIETINSNEKYLEDFENTLIPFEVNGDIMGVSFETWLNTSPEDTLRHFGSDWGNELFWKRNFYPHVSMILKDLISKGLIESGEYDIDIDW